MDPGNEITSWALIKRKMKDAIYFQNASFSPGVNELMAKPHKIPESKLHKQDSCRHLLGFGGVKNVTDGERTVKRTREVSGNHRRQPLTTEHELKNRNNNENENYGVSRG